MSSYNPFPLTTAPGYEDFAKGILSSAGEDIVWTRAGGSPVPLRAIIREKSQAIEQGYRTTTRHRLVVAKVAPEDVPGIEPGDAISARGRSYRVAPGGVHPDGVAFVRLDLREVSDE